MGTATVGLGPVQTTNATRRARVLGLGAWSVGAAVFGLACVERSPFLFATFAAWYVLLAGIVFYVVVASRRSQVALARENAIRFRELAIRDELTGLYNRRYFTAELETAVASSLDGGEPLSLAMIDLDGFKTINDSFGHAAGDEALRATAAAILQAAPGDATAARIGGDEFAVILPRCVPGEAAALAGRIRAALGRAELRHAARLQATIGVASLTASHDAGTLLREADSALYAGKRLGKAA